MQQIKLMTIKYLENVFTYIECKIKIYVELKVEIPYMHVLFVFLII